MQILDVCIKMNTFLCIVLCWIVKYPTNVIVRECGVSLWLRNVVVRAINDPQQAYINILSRRASLTLAPGGQVNISWCRLYCAF